MPRMPWKLQPYNAKTKSNVLIVMKENVFACFTETLG